MHKMYAQLTVLFVMIAYNNGELKHDRLKSWKNVTHFEIYETGKTNARAKMETDHFDVSVIEFELERRPNLHGNHLKTSVSNCLYEGFVIHNSEVDINSPIRLKHCSDATGKILELSGLLFLNQKVFTLHMNEDSSIILFNDDDVRNDVLRTKKCDPIKPELMEKHPINPMENNVKELPKVVENAGVNERYKRQTSVQQRDRSFAEVLIVISNDYYLNFGSSEQAVSSLCHIKDLFRYCPPPPGYGNMCY